MSSEPSVLVVGATGFIGGALARALIERGDPVRAAVRSGSAGRSLSELGAEVVEADLLDPASLRSAARGTSLIYHAGGANAMCPRDPGKLFEVNVRGTLNLVEAAAAVGVGRVVYTSSAATLGEARGTTATGESPHRGSFLSAYEHSKYMAESQAMERARTLGVDLICVNPSSVQGRGRTRGTAKWLIRYADGRLHWMVDTRVSLVAVDDCVLAHLQAARLGVPGRRYLVNGATLGIRELIDLVAEATGRRYPVHLVPAWAASAGGYVAGAAWGLASRPAPVCPEMVRTLLHGHAYDGSQAARELEFSYTPIRDFIRATLGWYWEHGLIRQSPTVSA